MTPRSIIWWWRFDSRAIFLRQCHFQNLLLLYQKSRLRSGGISLSSSPWIVTMQSYVMNASLYSCCFCFSKQEQTLYPGEPNNGNFRYVNCDFWDRSGKFLPQKNGRKIKTPSSKFRSLVSYCWEKNSIRNNAHNFFILSLVFLKLLIVGVAFFLGHPVLYSQTCLSIQPPLYNSHLPIVTISTDSHKNKLRVQVPVYSSHLL